MASKFETRKWEIEELGRIYESLENRIKDLSEDYCKLDEMEQQTKWNSDTREYEPVWEDEEQTVPKMVNKWGYVPYTDETFPEENRVKLGICEKLMTYIEALL